MSISSTVTRVAYTISALPQTLPTVFPFQVPGDLVVLDTGSGNSNDPALVLALGSDYTVSGGGYDVANNMQTGSIAVLSGGANNVLVGDGILIIRGTQLTQLTELLQTGSLTIALIEQALDKLTMIAQQVTAQVGRALQFENFETLDPTLILAQRVGNLLGFDGSGHVAYESGSTGGGGGGTTRANGIFTFNNAAQTLWTVTYGPTLSPAPTKIRLNFGMPSSTASIIDGNLVGVPGTTSFQVQLDGPTGDLIHTVFWEAL